MVRLLLVGMILAGVVQTRGKRFRPKAACHGESGERGRSCRQRASPAATFTFVHRCPCGAVNHQAATARARDGPRIQAAATSPAPAHFADQAGTSGRRE